MIKSRWILIAIVLAVFAIIAILAAGYFNQRSLRVGLKYKLDQISDTLIDLRDDYTSLEYRYSELEIVADSIEGIATERKYTIWSMEAQYNQLTADHQLVIDSIEMLHDSLLVPTLYDQLGYQEDLSDKTVIIRLPAIRQATIEIQKAEHCMEQLTEMTELYHESQKLVNDYEGLVSHQNMMLYVADSMNMNLSEQLNLTAEQRDIYKKNNKKQKAMKWVYLGLAGLVTGIAIIK